MAEMQDRAAANLSALIESTEDLISSVDLQYRQTTFNRALQKHIERAFHVRVAVGMRPESFLPPDKATLWVQLYLRALSEGPYRVEYPLTDGRTLELAFNPIVVEGKSTGVSVFGKDITGRKTAEEALKEAERKYRGIFDGAVEGIFQTSADCLVLSINRSAARMLGFDSPEEILTARRGAVYEAWADPNERARFFKHLDEQGAVRGFECQFKRRDGSTFWVSLGCRKVCGPDGQPDYSEGFFEDIDARKRSEIQHAHSEERYHATFEQAAVGILHTSLEGRLLRCNQRFADIIGYPHDEVCKLTFQQITLPEDLGDSVGVLKRMLDGTDRAASWEKRYIRKDGALTWIKLTVSMLRDSQGRALHFIAVVEDINARKAAEVRLAVAQEALRASEERYRTAFQTSLDAITINRLSDGTYVDVNKAFLDIVGYKREEVIGRTSVELEIWADLRDRQELVKILRSNSVCRNLEAQFRSKSGKLCWGLMSASLIQLDGVPCLLAMTRDISDAKAAEDQIRSLAFYDSLTGLPNRRLLLERLRQALAASTRSNRKRALLFVDLDNFKNLNDTLGHQAGDLLLQEIAQRLVASVRESDTVARLGGDEFVVMLEGLSEPAREAASQARAVAEKIQAAVREPCLLSGHEYFSTASIGITVFGDQLECTNEVMQQADIAMYQAKAAGRNTTRFFAPALQSAVNARAAMEEDLRQAIKMNQFLLYYQPQVDHGRVIGAEALVRWKHPVRGILFPDEFIPLAEETGLILPLGHWVLDTACKQIATWAKRNESAHLTLAVNISARQFHQPDFVEKVLEVLDRTGANPQTLKLELTESMLVEDVEDVIGIMADLKARGLRFSLDDFGTGYSSLSYLRRLPLDQLKIDRSFVRDMVANASSGAIAQAVISMGRAMGLSVIAEGVETEEQRELLASLGCHSLQGYLFSRPLPLEEFQSAWMDSPERSVLIPQ
jgi:diguanylate cyclase (GGDEF)-like protein/PAS domain S-box-containing protein